MEFEQQFSDLRKKFPSELGFTFALAHLMCPSPGDELIMDLERRALKPEDVIVNHNDNSMAMAGQLLKMLGSK